MKRLLFGIILLFFFITGRGSVVQSLKIADDIKIVVSFKDSSYMVALFRQKKLLKQKMNIISGTGSPQKPFQIELQVTNNNSEEWNGVIQIEIVSNYKNARFFLPGYMYGSNNGDAIYNPGLLRQFQRLSNNKSADSYSSF